MAGVQQNVLEKLAIAEQFSHNAQFAGVARQAVADGYSSIDALFSALLVNAGEEPPRNHKRKLDRVRELAPGIFDTREERSGNSFTYLGGIAWDEIEGFYREWLQSRYETFEMSAGTARLRVTTVLSANHFVIRWLADFHGEDWFELLAAIGRATYGYYDSSIAESLSRAHDRLFAEAEALGERVGRKLGIKMASTTNFCGADIIAGDHITRRLIEQDQEIADHAADVYVSFCRLMERVRTKRLEVIVADRPSIEHGPAFDLATDFMLSMKVKYHGESLSQTGEAIARMMAQSFGRFDSAEQPDE